MESHAEPRLAVIVPIGPGDGAWRALLPDLRGLPLAIELCLSFAGEVAADAADYAARVLPTVPVHTVASPAGRAQQLNAGIAATRAPHLWLLHADTRLGPEVPAALVRALAEGPDALVYFDLAFAADGPPWMGLNRLGAWVRSRWLGLPFGDQGFLIARARLAALGGFRTSDGRGEDHALIWRARRAGLRLHPARARLVTSARRYAECGWLATTIEHVVETVRQARRFRRAD